MPDLLAGSTVLALDTPPAVGAAESASFDATSTAYTTTATAGTYAEVAVVFTAPTSGRVKISVAARFINTTAGAGSLTTAEIREGAVIGSGTALETAADAVGCSHYGDTFARVGAVRLLSGLTAGDSYNARLLHRVTAGTGSFSMRELIAEPLS